MSDQTSYFLEELRQPRPDPGGGAAAAYGACVGLALLEKIVSLERSRQRRAGEETADWPDLLFRVRRFSTELNALRKEDVQVYLSLSAARFTAAKSKAQFSEQLAAAIEEAIRCPVDILRQCLSAGSLAAEIGQHCQEHLLADLLVAGELLGAAGAGAHHIARANLPLLRDPASKALRQKELAELGKQLHAMRQRLNERIG